MVQVSWVIHFIFKEAHLFGVPERMKLLNFLTYRGFKEDCPTGELYKEKIIEMYSLILPSGNAQVCWSSEWEMMTFGDHRGGSFSSYVRSPCNRCLSTRSSEYLTRTGMEALTSR